MSQTFANVVTALPVCLHDPRVLLPRVTYAGESLWQGPALLHAYRSRNLIMKKWVAAKPATSNIKFVDFDAMSLSMHAPPICAGENWHYQCFLTWCAIHTACVFQMILPADLISLYRVLGQCSRTSTARIPICTSMPPCPSWAGARRSKQHQFKVVGIVCCPPPLRYPVEALAPRPPESLICEAC